MLKLPHLSCALEVFRDLLDQHLKKLCGFNLNNQLRGKTTLRASISSVDRAEASPREALNNAEARVLH